MKKTDSNRFVRAHCTNDWLHDRSVFALAKTVATVIDKIVWPVRDHHSEHHNISRRCDCLELVNMSLWISECVFVFFECSKNEVRILKQSLYFRQIFFLQRAWGMPKPEIIEQAGLWPDDFRDLTCTDAVSQPNFRKCFLESLVPAVGTRNSLYIHCWLLKMPETGVEEPMDQMNYVFEKQYFSKKQLFLNYCAMQRELA